VLNRRGVTVWFTGLPSAGKTTIGRALAAELEEEGVECEVLDGDAVRTTLCKGLGFSKEDRDENIRRIGFVAGLLQRHGVVAIVSAISPYRAVRDELHERLVDFLEVYVNAPLAVCEQRDVKGLYGRARRGEITGMTGLDGPYEVPENPGVECHTDRETLEESVAKVKSVLREKWPELWKTKSWVTSRQRTE
jgi:adenylylsulfate kinase